MNATPEPSHPRTRENEPIPTVSGNPLRTGEGTRGQETGCGDVSGLGAGAVIETPWPAEALSPNARVHWSVRARAAKKARSAAWALAKAAKLPKPPEGPIRVTLTFQEPDARRRDLDGLLTRMKPWLDGIADALGVDDHRFEPVLRRGPNVKGGSVLVRVGE